MNTHEAPIALVGRLRPGSEPAVESCFGFGCLLRGSCCCYVAVELAPGGSTARATCLRNGEYPGYRPATMEGRCE